MMWWGNWPGWFGVAGGGFVLLVLLAALVTVGVVLARGTRRRSAATGSAEEVLAERFARGEIDEEEFARRRAALRGTADPPTARKWR
ncbi:SHOCT domain-containing protein [Pseudonocardia sp. GCM10023141]|uniref:SHOCT domain-containing protein n=1 Tax=Pseudonocardia sp. GCM10023141 TaxID=3252653 RepID=UPI003623D1C3